MLKLFAATWRYVSPILKKRWQVVLALVVLGALMGYLATFASLTESQLLNLSARESRGDGSKPTTVWELFSLQLPNVGTSEEEDWVNRALRFASSALPAGGALLVLIAAYVLIVWAGIQIAKLRSDIGREALTVLRKAALEKALRSESDQLPSESNIAGRLVSAIHQGAHLTSSAYEFLADGLQYIVALTIAIIAIVAVEYRFALFCLGVIFVQILVSLWQARRLEKRREAYDEQRNDLNSYTDEVLSKRELILAHERTSHYLDRVRTRTEKYAVTERDNQVTEARFEALSTLAVNLGRMLIVIGAIAVLFLSDQTLGARIGGVWFFVTMYSRVLAPAQNLVNRYDSLRRAAATSKGFIELLRQTHEDERGELVEKAPAEFRFRDVKFRYKGTAQKNAGRRWVLDNCSLRIPKGRVTLLIGPSGCGKSTIARLLLGFWRHQDGEIDVNSKAIRSVSRESLRLLSSYVSQEDFVIDETVRENLQWAEQDGLSLTDDQMLDALRAVGLARDAAEGHSFLDKPARSLSGGEKQRVAIARVFLDTAPVLILDEPLAGVDIFTIRDLMGPLKEAIATKERTTVIVTHRSVFMTLASHVIVMNADGKIAEEGDAEVLSRAGSVYSEILAAHRSPGNS